MERCVTFVSISMEQFKEMKDSRKEAECIIREFPASKGAQEWLNKYGKKKSYFDKVKVKA